MWPLFLAGCLNLDVDPDPWLIRDWTLDRPRVVGVRAWPPIVQSEHGVALQALALAPGPAPEVAVSLCGLRTDREVLVEDVACFDDPALVVQLADTVPSSWTAPDFTGAVCNAGDLQLGMRCVSIVPLLFDAGAAAAADTLAIALETPWSEREPPQLLSVRVHGATASPGDRVRIDVELQDGGQRSLQWWVDAGDLLDSGRTRTVLGAGTNELLIPEGFDGPLRVAVVAPGDDFVASSWGMATVWVGAPPETCTASLEVLAYRPAAPTQVIEGWQGDLWVLVTDPDGAPLASAMLPDVDVAESPHAVRVPEVPCLGPDTDVRVVAFLDTNHDGDLDEPVEPWGNEELVVGPGTLHDLAIALVAP